MEVNCAAHSGRAPWIAKSTSWSLSKQKFLARKKMPRYSFECIKMYILFSLHAVRACVLSFLISYDGLSENSKSSNVPKEPAKYQLNNQITESNKIINSPDRLYIQVAMGHDADHTMR